jgi:hypothetical protein
MSDVQRPIHSALTNNAIAGYWRVVVYPRWGVPLDVAMFRGVPAQMGSMSFTDPFGPKSFSIRFPQITIFDKAGEGELHWLKAFHNVDIIWNGDVPPDFPFERGVIDPPWRWEGYISTFNWVSGGGDSGTEIECIGAMRQQDDFLAKPEYPQRPLPYEWAISRQFLNKPSLRMNPLRVIWPDWWRKTYTPPKKGTANYMVPTGITKGKNWTGLLTRSTGSWDPTLTGYIQGLLTAMYTDRGRWTLDLWAKRTPVLTHREMASKPGPSTVVIDATHPDVNCQLSEDWTQSIGAVFAQGTSLAGSAYSGMQVSIDGNSTYYEPMASLRQVHPTAEKNEWLDRHMMRRETLVQVQPGLNADDAAQVARSHLQRFADPGVVGQIELGVDPMMNGVVIPRGLVRAGMDVHVPNLFGRREGTLLHISESDYNPATGKNTLTVDSKYRDALTVDEVRMRGRDALSVSRMLVAGNYVPPVPDQMFPWNYAEGSGYLPKKALQLFKGAPEQMRFPWEEWTTAHPPGNPKWRAGYVGLGATNANADKNWIAVPGPGGGRNGVPFRMAQSGQVRLLQVAAYDIDGHVLRVPFHISFFTSRGVNYQSMPVIPAAEHYSAGGYVYSAPMHYPFGRNAFEKYNPDGVQVSPKVPQTTESAGMIRAYGTFYEKAGYSPGAFSDGNLPTGLLIDETQWSFDTTGPGGGFDPYAPKGSLVVPEVGNLYAMIYCDAQNAQGVYFLGRLFRVEPGAG